MKTEYESPFNTRYASPEMKYIFSPERKFRAWRALWVALAKAEQKLGAPITGEQIAELERFKDDINYAEAEAREKIVRHDVMAHIYAYGLQCPAAKPIIHLGATSCYVGDNADLIIAGEALDLIKIKISSIIKALADFARRHKSLPTLAFTHFQPAQLTTVGKRACLWIYDLYLDYQKFDKREKILLGCKGTTGTQASFLELFNGDAEKVKALDLAIAREMGYEKTAPVSGQTYSRKLDSEIMDILRGAAESAAKFSSDIRLLQHLKEIEEPFEKNQIGSSAMAYKRNPMRSERIAALSRFVIANSLNAPLTAAAQWFERTLDDSANRRLAISESFLAVDSILNIYLNIAVGLVVYPNVIRKRIDEEIPFMATENILMNAVKKGGDRQELHEKIRLRSIEAAEEVKLRGRPNDLLERLAADADFNLTREELRDILKPEKYIGLCEMQVDEFLASLKVEDPALDNYELEF